MPRRMTTMGATEQFSATRPASEQQHSSAGASLPDVKSTGRVRHDEKITVYISREELIALERARLTLRGEHGINLDRGRLVRESIAATLEDLAARGADSDIVRRLTDR